MNEELVSVPLVLLCLPGHCSSHCAPGINQTQIEHSVPVECTDKLTVVTLLIMLFCMGVKLEFSLWQKTEIEVARKQGTEENLIT